MMRFIVITFITLLLFSSCAGNKHIAKSKVGQSKTVTKPSAVADKAVKASMKYKGTKYKYGGTTKRGIDCSGLMCASYQEAGVTLPRVSREQAKLGKRVYIGELQKGDLVFFGSKPGSKKITHVGMITKVSKSQILFIHASTSKGVIESDLKADYYRKRYILARRIK